MTIYFDQYYNTGIGDTPLRYGGEDYSFVDSYWKAFENQLMGSNTDSITNLMQEELDPLIALMNENWELGKVESYDGQPFENPGDYYYSILDDSMNRRRETLLKETFKHLRENPGLYPGYEDFDEQKLADRIRERAIEFIQSQEEVSTRTSGLGTIAEFFGSASGLVVDKNAAEIINPIIIAELFYGSGKMKLGQAILKEAAIGSGVEAMLQSDVKDWYNSLGLDYTYEDFLKNVGIAGIVSGSIPVAGRFLRGGVRLTRDQIKRGIEAFKGRGIDPVDADIQVRFLENMEDLTSADAPGGPLVPTEQPSGRTIDLNADEWQVLGQERVYVNQLPDLESINGQALDDVFMPNPPVQVRPLQIASDSFNNTVESLKTQQPFATIDRLYELAPIVQAKLDTAGTAISKSLGVEFKSPGIKDKKTAQEKITRRGYSNPNQLSDVVRAGFLVNTPRKADEVVAKLSETFDVVDEGWQITPSGYFDRKVLIKNDDGVLGEVQIWSPELLKAKDSKGHSFYERYRTSTDAKEKAQLELAMQNLYSKALEKENQSFSTLFGILKDPNRLANIRLKAASPGTTAAELKTSAASTGVQGPPGSRMATAANSPDEVLDRIAGRPSQDVKIGSDITPPESSVTQLDGRIAKAKANLEKGNLPDDNISTSRHRPAPPETKIDEPDVDNFVDQVSRDTDFDNLADDEIINLDLVMDDEVVTRSVSGADIKKELAQDQQMLDRLRGCVV